MRKNVLLTLMFCISNQHSVNKANATPMLFAVSSADIGNNHIQVFIIIVTASTKSYGDPRRAGHQTFDARRPCFPVAADRAWNTLPPNVTSESTLSSFRRRLLSFLYFLCLLIQCNYTSAYMPNASYLNSMR